MIPCPAGGRNVLPLSPDARWNPERSAVEFSIGIGDYEGVARVGRRVFQRLLDQAPTPERCLEAYHLHRTRLDSSPSGRSVAGNSLMMPMLRSPAAICENRI